MILITKIALVLGACFANSMKVRLYAKSVLKNRMDYDSNSQTSKPLRSEHNQNLTTKRLL